MKTVFIAFDQAHRERIIDILDRSSCRGFTSWNTVEGRGSVDGEPHYGSHAWPSMASAILTVVPDERVAPLLERLRALDAERPKLGLRAFVWNVEQSMKPVEHIKPWRPTHYIVCVGRLNFIVRRNYRSARMGLDRKSS